MTSRILLPSLFAAVWVMPAIAANVAPTLIQTPPDLSLARAGSVTNINLKNYIEDPDVPGTAVRITVRAGTLGTGNIDLALYDQQTPLTVANFLAYINAGRYVQNIVHRSIPPSGPTPGFIIQGGGFAYELDGGGNATVNAVPTFSAVLNEPGISNVRGTIAMAKVDGNVSSATSQWFINMRDNASNLDSQNGGFTVFGRVVGNGMAVADVVNTMPTYNASGFIADWTNIPLSAASLDIGNIVETNAAIIPALTFTANSGNISLVSVSINGSTLSLTPSASATGHTSITVIATDLDGAQLQTTFGVDVLETYDNWQAGISFANPTVAAETADPDSDGLPNLLEFAFGGDPLLARPVPAGFPVAEPGGGVTFYQRQTAGLLYQVYESADLVNWTLSWQSADGFAVPAVAAHSMVSGFDVLTIRNPAAYTLRFWKVQVSRSL